QHRLPLSDAGRRGRAGLGERVVSLRERPGLVSPPKLISAGAPDRRRGVDKAGVCGENRRRTTARSPRTEINGREGLMKKRVDSGLGIMNRRHFLSGTAAAGFVLVGPGDIRAQEWPAKPISLVIMYAPGGGTDTLMRVIGQEMA